jgi:hypothetical protein
MPSSGKILSVYTDSSSNKFGAKFLPDGSSECIHLGVGRTVEDSKSVTIDGYWEVLCELSNGAMTEV